MSEEEWASEECVSYDRRELLQTLINFKLSLEDGSIETDSEIQDFIEGEFRDV